MTEQMSRLSLLQVWSAMGSMFTEVSSRLSLVNTILVLMLHARLWSAARGPVTCYRGFVYLSADLAQNNSNLCHVRQ